MLTYEKLGAYGRLGNQLWQISSTLGVAKAMGESVSLPVWKYAQWFSFPDVFKGAEGQEISQIHDDYLQNLDHLKPVEQESRAWMKPSEQALDALADHIATYRPETCSAVHVRRGDYAEEWRGHGMLPAEWYLRVWPRGRVLVFSDEPEWCEHHLPGEVVHSEDWMDLILMSMCQEFTISNSSFAWWAAWTSGKHTFAPTPWFPGHVYNLYPDHWTMVPR